MTTINLTEVPREQLPQLVDFIREGKATIYFSMMAHCEYEFLSETARRPSETGRYELEHPVHIVDELQRLYRGQGFGGISLPVILDNDQQPLYVVRTDDDGWSLDEHGHPIQGINLVRFPYDQFQVKWHDGAEESSGVHATGYLALAFLKDHPTGGKAELLRWLDERPEVTVVSEPEVCWEDPAGKEHYKTLKTFRNQIAKYRKYLAPM